jgi:hypothetical protein
MPQRSDLLSLYRNMRTQTLARVLRLRRPRVDGGAGVAVGN